MQIEAGRKEIFTRALEQLNMGNLTKLISCQLCKGLLRLAHTLIQCGHTFCKVCLMDYIGRFKGKKSAPKCPMCQSNIDPNHKKSIFRDSYKQSIADLLSPECAKMEADIVRKVMELFPACGLSSLLGEIVGDKAEFDPKTSSTRAANEQLLRRLPQVIKNNLNITYDKFIQRLHEDPETALQEFAAKLKTAKTVQPDKKCKINLFPKTNNDFECIKIKNQVESPTTSVDKLCRFLEKRFYSTVSDTGKLPVTLASTSNFNVSLSITVKLWIGERELNILDNLELLRKEYAQEVLSLEYEVVVPQ